MMMNSIPLELIHEIFSRLPVKSIARCRCVSEQWRSILCSADFTELFLTKSSTRPSLFLAVKSSRNNNDFFFFSSPQLDDKSLSSSPTSVRLKLSKDMPLELCGHASGLFCLRRMSKEVRDEKDEYTEHVICNPSTVQYGFLPRVRTGSKSFLGYDPIDKVFKVVSSNATYLSRSNVLNVLTLGTGEVEWRKINSPLDHHPWSEGICINGVLYYLAQGATYYIVCFDVRFEEFKFMDIEFTHVYATRLINYEGKLGRISWSRFSRMTMWVLEDVEKHDWSKHLFTLPDGDKHSRVCGYAVGVTATGEIVLMEDYYHSKPFYVFYFHPERNTVKRLEVQGFEHHGGGSRVYASVDHVDDLTFNMKSWQLHQDVPPKFESFNKFRALRLLDDV